jgi:hypothetical protein
MPKNKPFKMNRTHWLIAIALLIGGLSAGFAGGVVYQARRIDTTIAPTVLPLPTTSPAICSCPMIPAGSSSSAGCSCK